MPCGAPRRSKIEKNTSIINFISTEIQWIPLNSVDIQNEKKDAVTEFLDSLEDDDDVQNVFSNINLEVN